MQNSGTNRRGENTDGFRPSITALASEPELGKPLTGRRSKLLKKPFAKAAGIESA